MVRGKAGCDPSDASAGNGSRQGGLLFADCTCGPSLSTLKTNLRDSNCGLFKVPFI